MLYGRCLSRTHSMSLKKTLETNEAIVLFLLFYTSFVVEKKV